MSKAWKGTERRTARALSLWWTGNPKAFIRAPCSGGWPHARAEGDMVANVSDRTVPSNIKTSALVFVHDWSMDVKRRIRGSSGSDSPWTFEELLTAKKHPILGWWQEITELAKARETLRFLVLNKATRHSFVMLGDPEIQHIRSRTTSLDTLRTIAVNCSPEVSEVLTVIELRSFLKTVDARALGGLGCDPTKLDASEAAAQDTPES